MLILIIGLKFQSTDKLIKLDDIIILNAMKT